MKIIAAPVTMDDVIANSFKDYHVKGMDYLCLRRSPTLTSKLYFFDGDVSKLPEVVNPHDHRYDFRTTCLAGRVDNSIYRVSDRGQLYERFQYRTKLNGGDGFTWVGTEYLEKIARRSFRGFQRYSMCNYDIHTIHLRAPETVLLLEQYEDRVSLDGVTSTFTKDVEPPSLSGLYSQFTPDDIRRRLAQLRDYSGIVIELAEHKDIAA